MFVTSGLKVRENAGRLYEDVGRDALDIFSAFSKWGIATEQRADWIDRLSNAKESLGQRAALEGIQSLDGHYKQVSEAAAECGMGEHFRISYKMLSKFAYPTAMQLMAAPNEEIGVSP